MNIHASDDKTTITLTDIESNQLYDIVFQEVVDAYNSWKGSVYKHAGKHKKNKL